MIRLDPGFKDHARKAEERDRREIDRAIAQLTIVSPEGAQELRSMYDHD